MRLSNISQSLSLALALTFVGSVAIAQTPPAPSAVAPATETPRPHTRMSLNDRFEAANTTHDGHLTFDQARAGLPMVARNFAAMDKDNKGYVTLDEIHTYLKEQRAARRQTAAPNGNG